MKSTFALLLALALLLTAGCAPAPAESQPAVSDPPAAVLPDPSAAPIAPAVPAEMDAETGRALEDMHPVLDSVLRTVGVGEGTAWLMADRDTELWTGLYLLAVNWCFEEPRTRIEGPNLIVPRQAMNEWAGALSADFSHLPELPPDVTFLHYDAVEKTYTMELSDAGATETRIDSKENNGDGTYAVKLGLYDEMGTRLGGMDFVLIDNPFLLGPAANPQLDDPDILPVENPVFRFTVRSAMAE